jgi:hypothetical protein
MPSKIYPNWNIWLENIPSGNPAQKSIYSLIKREIWWQKMKQALFKNNC